MTKINNKELQLYLDRLLPSFVGEKDKKHAERVIREAVKLGYSNLRLWSTKVENSEENSIHDLVGTDKNGMIRFLYLN